MTSNQIITAAVDALTGKMVYSFTLKNRTPEAHKRSLLDRITRKEPQISELERTFNIYPCVVANQYRIAAKALSLPNDLFDDQANMLAYVPEHLPTMVYIIACAVTNTKNEPKQDIIEYLTNNLDSEDVLEILSASLQATNMQSFLTSIVLMNGMAKILTPKASPQDGRELIASHTQE